MVDWSGGLSTGASGWWSEWVVDWSGVWWSVVDWSGRVLSSGVEGMDWSGGLSTGVDGVDRSERLSTGVKGGGLEWRVN